MWFGAPPGFFIEEIVAQMTSIIASTKTVPRFDTAVGSIRRIDHRWLPRVSAFAPIGRANSTH